ncbi:MAG TPA: serine hydrolase domain-containing protein [Solirubrobacterales bacterium]|nr:serine hydrolase domain-containing protein [Solirubrobacterales bacterium]
MSRLHATLASLLALVLLAAFAAPAGAAPLGKSTEAKLESALTRTFEKTKAPGVMAGVWIGGKGWTAVRGSTKKGKQVTPSLADHTRIGSVTKTFTGTVILQLVDEGKLKLDESIAKWFPTAPEAGRITIRDLGDMSSGINTYTADAAITTRYFTHPQTVWKSSELIAGGLAQPRKFPPGEGFFYSDTNTLMLGEIAEDVTGKSIATLLRERIFRPLALKGTSFPTTTKLPAPFWNGYTDQNVEGTKVRDSTNWSPTFAGAAGQIVSTVPDLHRWAIALGTGSLISKGAQQQRLKPNPASVDEGREYLFCLGRDHGWLIHTGDIPGYNTTVAYLPKKKAVIVVAANTDIEAEGDLPTPVLTSALAEVISPGNVPTGTH